MIGKIREGTRGRRGRRGGEEILRRGWSQESSLPEREKVVTSCSERVGGGER